MAYAPSLKRMKQWRKDVGAFPPWPEPSLRQAQGPVVELVETQRGVDGRRLLLLGVATLVAFALFLWLSGGITTAPTARKAILTWDGVQYMGVGRDFSQVVRGMGPCIKVEQWLQPVDDPTTGKTVNILKGVCVEMKPDDNPSTNSGYNTDATN